MTGITPGAGKKVLEQSLIGQPGGTDFLPEFWSRMAEEPWVAAHPAMDPLRLCSTCGVPLFIHADETEYVDSQKAYVISISGIAHGDPVITKLLVAVLPSDLMHFDDLTNVTLQTVLAFVKWSFEVLLTGVWPLSGYGGAPLAGSVGSVRSSRFAGYRVRRAGQPLAGGFFGVFAGIKGDMVWIQDAFGFERYYRCTALCRFCHASQAAGPLLWTNVAADAPWRDTEDPDEMHGSLVGLPGLHHCNVHSDLLHLLWVKGVGNDLVGTTLVLLATYQAFSSKPEDVEFEVQLYAGYQLFKKWCKDNHITTTAEPWKPASVHYTMDLEFPFIGGKGADVRLISLWLHYFVSHDHPETEIPVVVAAPWYDDLKLCLHYLACFTHDISSMPVLLLADQSAKLRRLGEAFVVVYLRLASVAVSSGMTHFKIRPKVHYLHHLALRIKILNPKVVSCFGEESYMGVIGKLAGMCHRRTMPHRVIQRYMLRLSQVLQRLALESGAARAP